MSVDNGISKSVNCRKCRPYHKYQEPTIQTVLRLGPLFLFSVVAKGGKHKKWVFALLGESKIKIGSQTEWKASLVHWFFSLFSFRLFSLGLWSPSRAKNPLLFPLSPGISIFIPFLINRGITEWEWGERSFFFVFNFFTRMNNYLESSLSYYVKQNSNQPMKTNPTLNQ